MAYTITLTNGNVLTTVADNSINTNYPLALPGRNYAGYGDAVDNNFIHGLENFANTTPPANSLVGQLWYNSANAQLYVCKTQASTDVANGWTAIAYNTPNTIGAAFSTGALSANSANIAGNVTITGTLTGTNATFQTISVSSVANVAGNFVVGGLSNLANVQVSGTISPYGATLNTTGIWNFDRVVANYVTSNILLSAANAAVNNLVVNTNSTLAGNIVVASASNVNLANAATIQLNSAANLKITGGNVGQFLSTDGTGNLTWANVVTSVPDNGVPQGTIVIWSGSASTIPQGWALCDGNNGTPDLRNKFVLAAGGTYAIGQTGGSADSVLLRHSHTVNDPGHTHSIKNILKSNQNGFISIHDRLNWATVETESAKTGISINDAGTAPSGNGLNMPPYYALCYIQRISDGPAYVPGNGTGNISSIAMTSNTLTITPAAITSDGTFNFEVNAYQNNIIQLGTLNTLTVAGNAVLPSISNVGIIRYADGSTQNTAVPGLTGAANITVTNTSTLNIVTANTITSNAITSSTVRGNITLTTGAPDFSTSVGNAGQLAYASGYIYVCVAANTWQRANLTTW